MSFYYRSDYHVPLTRPIEVRHNYDYNNKHVKASIMNAERYMPSPSHGRHKTSNVPVMIEDDASSCAAVTSSTSSRKLKRKLEELSVVSDASGNMVMFQGRDESYPDELNKLIQPLSCQLCKTQMTSMKSAKDHYESKAHDRHISAWLAKNYTEVGLDIPPIKRLVKVGPTGPNAFHCQLCDLPLTSSMHAQQHYSGRKHLLVAQNRTKPSGAGYYNAEGKWVRTGTKAGELFVKTAIEVDANNSRKEQQQQQLTASIDESLTCKICKITVTSSSEIQMHLDGAKHQRNLRKQNGDDIDPIDQAAVSTFNGCNNTKPEPISSRLEANPELTMYRTPSGLYYCKLCNKAMNHISILHQHLMGKKHIKNERQQMEESNTHIPKI